MSPHRKATATAHANIALIKYWGKADEALIIPRTPSLSLTLDELYTTTTVEFGGEGAESTDGTDRAALDGVPVTGRAMERITAFLDIVRERAGIRDTAQVASVNTVPTAAGLASSASGFAALAGAAAAAADLDLDDRDLSRLARRGSGSASRSVFGGLAVWNAGTDDATSYAEPVAGGAEISRNLAIVVLVINDGPKGISSREAMRRTVDTSPDYAAWVDRHAGDLAEARAAIVADDLARLGEATEANALGMHATMRAAVPPVDYLTADSHAALQAVQDARAEGFPAWATMDAGPNVKVLTSAEQADALDAWLRDRLMTSVPGMRTLVTHAGPGLTVEKGQ